METKTCPQCNNIFYQNKKEKFQRKFCSRSCANSRQFSQETCDKKSVSAKTSQKVKEAIQRKRVVHVKATCPCGKEIISFPSKKKKYCSVDCANLYKKRSPGGYRNHSGRSKSGYYNGVYCGSTYELCWAIYNIDHNFPFERFQGFLFDGTTKYYPDFISKDHKTIYEMKGYENAEKVALKSRLAISKGFDINVLRKADLIHCFEYVKNKFGTTKFHTLYDGYKPSLQYNCSHCGSPFERERIPKTKTVFCSRKCAGLHLREQEFKSLMGHKMNIP